MTGQFILSKGDLLDGLLKKMHHMQKGDELVIPMDIYYFFDHSHRVAIRKVMYEVGINIRLIDRDSDALHLRATHAEKVA
jgi:hypothetical protein